jgi:hypothetical protein
MKIKGIIDFSTSSGKKERYYNEITKLGDMYFKAKATQGFTINRAIEEGFDFIQSWLLPKNDTAIVDIANKDKNIAIYLLNLTQAELDAITPDTTTLPIYTPGTMEIDHSKIVGWASIDRVSVQAKQGILTGRIAANIVDDWVSSIAWQWDEGKATGTFNFIAIGPNVLNTGSDRYNGLNIFKGLERNDVLNGEAVPSGYMLRNGVTGITGANEILIGDATSGTVGRVKLDLVLGTRTELAPGDPGYDFPLMKADRPQVIIGDRLFYRKDELGDIWVYDMVAETHTDTGINFYNTSYAIPSILLTKGGYLYTAGTYTTLYAYNPTTYARVSAADIQYADLGIPSDISTYYPESLKGVSIGNYGNQFIAVPIYNILKTTSKAILLSDLAPNSLLRPLPLLKTTANYLINNEVYNFDTKALDDIYQGIKEDGGAVSYLAFGTHGVKYCKYVGNMLSYKKLTTAQTIAATEKAKVEYSYKYGE